MEKKERRKANYEKVRHIRIFIYIREIKFENKKTNYVI
jgi:hypothetical protein